MARLLVALAAGASALRLAPTMTAAPPKTGAVLRRAAGAAALGGALLAGSDAALAAGNQPGAIYYKQLEDCATSKQFGKRQRKTVATLEGRMKKYEPGKPAVPRARADAEPGEQPLQALRRLEPAVRQGRPPAPDRERRPDVLPAVRAPGPRLPLHDGLDRHGGPQVPAHGRQDEEPGREGDHHRRAARADDHVLELRLADRVLERRSSPATWWPTRRRSRSRRDKLCAGKYRGARAAACSRA